MRRITLFLLFLFVCSATSIAQGLKPDRAAFLNEVLDPRPTAVTPKFDDYHPGNYHAQKQDLLDGLIAETKKRGMKLRCIAMVGPTGGLWAYHIAVFLQERDNLRVNTLVFAHARITSKKTGLISVEKYDAFVASLESTGVLNAKRPPPARFIEDNPREAIEWGYNAILAVWKPDLTGPVIQYGKLLIMDPRAKPTDTARAKAFTAAYDQMQDGLKRTYPPAKK